MKTDGYNDHVIVPLLEAADQDHTDALSAYVDTAGWGSVEFVVTIGALTGVDADNYLTPILQEASTTPAAKESYSAVASTAYLGGFSKVDAAAEDSTVQRAVYTGSERYAQVKLDYTGTGITAGIVGVYAICSKPKKQPASALTPTTGTVS